MARPRRPGPLAALGLFLAVLVAATAWIGVRAVFAERHLSAARTQLVAARDALQDRDLPAAEAAIAAAGERTRRARSLTGDPVWRVAGAFPGYGDTALTVTVLARAADDLARQVLPRALDGVEQLDPARLRSPEGVVDLQLVAAATPSVTEGASAAEEVQAQVQSLPTGSVVRQVAQARDELEEQVVELAQALRGGANALEVAPALLGGDRPRRYLLLVQQTAESRGTGGLIGGYVEVVADGGRVTAVASGSNRDLVGGPVPVPADVPADFAALYEPLGAFDLWPNVNLSPDLPVVADVVEARWAAQGGQALDGVAFLDGTALQQILAGTGPVPLPDGRSFPPEQIGEYLAVEQYRGVPLTPAGLLTRKDQLEDVAVVVADRVTSGDVDSLALLRGITAAVRSGHLRMASDDPALRTPLALAGVDGALPAGLAPLSYPVVYNSTGGKLDHFLDRAVRYSGGDCRDGRRETTVEVTLTNQAPPTEQLPPYVTIRQTPQGVQASNANSVTLVVYGTRGASLRTAALDGTALTDVATGVEAGLPFWATVVELPAGQPRVLTLELDEPAADGRAEVVEQPLSRPLVSTVDVRPCG